MPRKNKNNFEELVQKFLNAKTPMEKKLLEALIKRINPDWKAKK